MRSLLLGAALVLAGCQDLRSFRGSWGGGLTGDSELAAGFPTVARAALTIDSADHLGLHGRLTISGLFDGTPIDSVRRASGDALGAVKVGAAPLHSYVAFAEAQTGTPALAVISLFQDDRVELRIIRGTDELYGVFLLRRQ